MKKYIFALSLLALPATSFAAENTLITAIATIQGILNALIPVIITLAVIFFFWGLVQYVMGSGSDEASKKDGRDKMVYGLIAIFVMVSVWGLVGILRATFFTTSSDTTTIKVPTFK